MKHLALNTKPLQEHRPVQAHCTCRLSGVGLKPTPIHFGSMLDNGS